MQLSLTGSTSTWQVHSLKHSLSSAWHHEMRATWTVVDWHCVFQNRPWLLLLRIWVIMQPLAAPCSWTFFPFNLLPLCSALVLIYWSSFSCFGDFYFLPLVEKLTERCVARAITNCMWYQTEITASGSDDTLWQVITTLCCFLFHFLIDLSEQWTTLRAAPLVRRPVISRTCPDLFLSSVYATQVPVRKVTTFKGLLRHLPSAIPF